MKKFKLGCLILSILCATFILFPLSSFSSGKEETKERERPVYEETKERGNNAEPVKPIIEYKPPMRGKPSNRVGGGTRGTGKGIPSLIAMVPENTGLTIHAQPSLYWFISKTTPCRAELTLNDEDSIKPLLETVIDGPQSIGIHCLRLSGYDIELMPGKEYEWYIAIVSDAEHRSSDIVASGRIERIEPSEALKKRMKDASEFEHPNIYAAEGLWYDALCSLSDLIAAHPKDELFRLQRASLLEQIGLEEIAGNEKDIVDVR